MPPIEPSKFYQVVKYMPDQQRDTYLDNHVRRVNLPKATEDNYAAAKDGISDVFGVWGSVLRGKAVLGGTDPADSVAAAEGAWEKATTFVTAYGGNALLGAGVACQGSALAVADGTQALFYGAASLVSKG